ncbi:MAG: hypothetical protein ACR2RD_08835 [Woeseiaceae bacterium]
MNKNFLISWAVIFVVWMASSFAVHGGWLAGAYADLSNLYRPDEEQMGLFHFMLLAHVLMAGAFVWIYQRGQENKPWLQQGIRFGIAIAILAPIPTYMIYFTVLQLPGALAFNQIIGDSLTVIVLGALVAFLSRNRSKA